MLTFNRQYFIVAVFLLIVEILIALYVHDNIVRPYLGDFLVVIMLYCFARAFIWVSVIKAAIGVLIFAYLIEFLQYVDLIGFLSLRKSRLVNVVLGNYFEWIDMISYNQGIVAVLMFERIRQPNVLRGSVGAK
jgi:hypothetical protein